ncbi:MAG TPA: energy transducer TonB, partial [Perlabentimonas sp.]|nr:energy transducer TonB [Perlabentimonas sp.]
ALALVLTAFEWESTGGDFELLIDNRVVETPIEMIITDINKIVPPPPPIIPIAEIIRIHKDDAVDIDDNTAIFEEINEDIIHFILTKTEEVDVVETLPFALIEEKPTFMGGDYNEFTKWVYSKLKYPVLAAQNGIQGRVLLQFLIDTDGSVSNITVIRSEDKLLAEEAVRVVSMSPKWEPGLQRNNPAKVIFTFPITFRLQ